MANRYRFCELRMVHLKHSEHSSRFIIVSSHSANASSFVDVREIVKIHPCSLTINAEAANVETVIYWRTPGPGRSPV